MITIPQLLPLLKALKVWPPGGGSGGQVNSVGAGTGIAVDSTDPVNPVVSCTVTPGGQVNSVVAGANITVDNTDPENPVISATGGGGGGGVESVTSSQPDGPVRVDNTDPANPSISFNQPLFPLVMGGSPDAVISLSPFYFYAETSADVPLSSNVPHSINFDSDKGSWYFGYQPEDPGVSPQTFWPDMPDPYSDGEFQITLNFRGNVSSSNAEIVLVLYQDDISIGTISFNIYATPFPIFTATRTFHLSKNSRYRIEVKMTGSGTLRMDAGTQLFCEFKGGLF